jgi:hypothetical protein
MLEELKTQNPGYAKGGVLMMKLIFELMDKAGELGGGKASKTKAIAILFFETLLSQGAEWQSLCMAAAEEAGGVSLPDRDLATIIAFIQDSLCSHDIITDFFIDPGNFVWTAGRSFQEYAYWLYHLYGISPEQHASFAPTMKKAVMAQEEEMTAAGMLHFLNLFNEHVTVPLRAEDVRTKGTVLSPSQQVERLTFVFKGVAAVIKAWKNFKPPMMPEPTTPLKGKPRRQILMMEEEEPREFVNLVGGAKTVRCYECKEEGHFSNQCPKRQGGREWRGPITCFNCGEQGHVVRNCRQPLKCRICRGVGHRAADCLKRGAETPAELHTPASPTKRNRGSNVTISDRVEYLGDATKLSYTREEVEAMLALMSSK